ncbi:rhodanese-like domain-containing protein [Rhodopirellula halodulae]|uniref:rhodanese-like domain-containing protein n=1 Tax=Rhodopirellula halodulae TaxID=2894198 RepID=UPI001E3812F7|nr:rhodanese-like domain-containing protein [Rhodopirellula sp. JC737]MCC9656247.1 rhodanese-like domain-containing protein [Rhodopirellula sp. JC737]
MKWLSKQFVFWLNRIAPWGGGHRVPVISTEELAHRIRARDPSLILVDARSDAERSVSRIPGAISVDEFQRRSTEFGERCVVASCTVGGRSWFFAHRCIRQGMNAVNHQDGILGWCESGLELESPTGEVTHNVHTHNRWFGAPTGYQQVNRKCDSGHRVGE